VWGVTAEDEVEIVSTNEEEALMLIPCRNVGVSRVFAGRSLARSPCNNLMPPGLVLRKSLAPRHLTITMGRKVQGLAEAQEVQMWQHKMEQRVHRWITRRNRHCNQV
jgi:hypothetical protein